MCMCLCVCVCICGILFQRTWTKMRNRRENRNRNKNENENLTIIAIAKCVTIHKTNFFFCSKFTFRFIFLHNFWMNEMIRFANAKINNIPFCDLIMLAPCPANTTVWRLCPDGIALFIPNRLDFNKIIVEVLLSFSFGVHRIQNWLPFRGVFAIQLFDFTFHFYVNVAQTLLQVIEAQEFQLKK